MVCVCPSSSPVVSIYALPEYQAPDVCELSTLDVVTWGLPDMAILCRCAGICAMVKAVVAAVEDAFKVWVCVVAPPVAPTA